MITADLLTAFADAWQRSQGSFWDQAMIFLSLALRGVGVALVLGIPAGILLTRAPRVSSPVTAVLALLQTIPSLALLGLVIPWLGIGQPAAIFAAVVYSLLPIVSNTFVGITQVPPAIRDAARGMGMTWRQMLWTVEIPLAMPVIIAGVRTGAVYAVGVITVCALAGAGGLGDYIVTGLTRGDDGLILVGAVPILALTLAMFWVLGGIAHLSKRNSAVGLAVGGGLILGLAVYAAAEPWWKARRSETAARGRILIGSKNFTEGRVLSEILLQMIAAHTDLSPEAVPNLGSNLAYKSLLAKRIDLYPEYTGNLLTGKEALNLPVPDDKSGITALVREQMELRHGLVLLDLFGFNNTYALCVPAPLAERYRLKEIGDLTHTPELRVIVDLEFLDRPDGWNGLVEAYGLQFQMPPRQVSPDLIYRALESGEADLVCGFATDWQIDAMGLVMLEDNLGYFPHYHGAPLVRGEVLNRHPEIREVLGRLAGQIDDRTMRRLNAEVAVGRKSESEVARAFLLEKGLLPHP